MAKIAYSIAIREALLEEMEADESVFLMGEDIADFGGCFGITRGFLKKFGPERVRNTPISENSFVGVGLGAALMGLRPVVEIMFMDFITLAMDQIVNHAAKFHYMYAGQVKVPLVIRTAAGAGRGYGATHSQTLDSWLLSVPGIKVVAPAFPRDAKGLLKSAIRDNNPVIFIENKVLYSYMEETAETESAIPIGKANVVRNGSDITIVSYSRMLHECLAAANELKNLGVSAEVIDLRSLYPLDIETIVKSVKKTQLALLVEEGVSRWGVCSEIACQITDRCFSSLRSPVARIGSPDVPIPCGFELEKEILPSADTIAVKSLELVGNDYKNIKSTNKEVDANILVMDV